MWSNYFSLNTVIELVCFLTACICLVKAKEIEWKLMIVLLLATFLSETAGRYIYLNIPSHNNHWVYNIFILFEIVITHFVFVHLYNGIQKFKPLLVAGFILLILSYSHNIYNNGFWVYSMRTYSLMSVLFVLYSLIYYYHLLTDDELVHLRFSSEFWLVTGLFMFSFGATACNIFAGHLHGVMLGTHHLTYYIFRVLNVILYGFWSYAFICKRWLEPAGRAGFLRKAVNNT